MHYRRPGRRVFLSLSKVFIAVRGSDDILVTDVSLVVYEARAWGLVAPFVQAPWLHDAVSGGALAAVP